LQNRCIYKNADSSRNSETVKIGPKQDKKLTHQVLKLGQTKMWECKKCQKVMKLNFTRIILGYPLNIYTSKSPYKFNLKFKYY